MSAVEKLALINNVATIFLVIVCLTACRSSILRRRKQIVMLFALLLIVNIAIDMVGFFTVGKGLERAYEISMAINTFNLIFRMVTASMPAFFRYRAETRKYTQNKRRRILIMFMPVILGTVLLIVNIFTGVVFSVDRQGRYTGNSGVFIINGIIIMYLLAVFVLPLLKNNNAGSKPVVSMFALVIPVGTGIIIRTFLLPEVQVGLLGASVSLLIFVISMGNAESLYDSFTRVYNKEYLTYYLERNKRDHRSRVAGIMIDVNNLKIINDEYGHKAGDEILKKAVSLIRKMKIENSALVRFGGDEFILLLSVSDIETVRDVMLNIKERLFQYEAEDTSPYKLSLSMGTTIYIPGENISSFVRRMDEQMYLEKKAYHEAYAQ